MASNNNQNIIFRNLPIDPDDPNSATLEIAPIIYNPVNITATSNVTLTVNDILGQMINRNANGGNRSDTTPTASDLIVALGGANVPNGQSFQFIYRQSPVLPSDRIITLVGGNGVNLIGSGAVGGAQQKRFLGIVQSDRSISLYNLGLVSYYSP